MSFHKIGHLPVRYLLPRDASSMNKQSFPCLEPLMSITNLELHLEQIYYLCFEVKYLTSDTVYFTVSQHVIL